MGDRRHQRDVVERLGDRWGIDRGGDVSSLRIAVTGDEDDGSWGRAAAEPFAQFGAAETRQPHIDNEAIDGHGLGLEILCRPKHVYVVAQAAEEPRECLPHILVVVDNRQRH